jgi:predicted RNase H-like nuclease
MDCVLGIDAAWTNKNASGVALVVTDGGHATLIRAAPSFEDFILGTEPQAWRGHHDHRASLRDVLRKAEEIGGAPATVIAVDVPLAHEPVRARRYCDNAISRTFGARGCSTHSPTEQRPGKVSDALYEDAQRAGFVLKTLGSSMDGGALLEVYPHVALLELCGAERRIPYKISRRRRYWPEASPAERLANIKQSWDEVVRRLSQRLDLDFAIDCAGKRLRYWKAWEDVIDAVVCAWVGLEWLRGHARPYGDRIAAIWIPERGRGISLTKRGKRYRPWARPAPA